MTRPARAGSLRAWVLASRPATLAASVMPVVVGSACARGAGGFRAGPALAALFASVLIQIGTNLANDVFDYEKGADRAGRFGPTRVTQAGLLTAGQVRAGMWLAFGLATAAGLYLTLEAGWPVVVIGLASIASGIAYTAGPYPLGYLGLGDLFVMVFFGFAAVCGTAFVQLGAVPPSAWLASIPVGALVTAILVVNNIRDRQGDARAGKKTVAVRFGRKAALAEYALLVAIAYAVPCLLAAGRVASPWALLPLATLPWGILLVRGVIASKEGPGLNRFLVRTSQLLVAYGILLAIGIARRAPGAP